MVLTSLEWFRLLINKRITETRIVEKDDLKESV